MSDTAQDYQKLISDALQKQMVILGRQVTLLKARNVQGLSISDDGLSVTISGDPQKVITQFLGQFRELSSPLVKKTMQPLLNAALPIIPQTMDKAPGAPEALVSITPTPAAIKPNEPETANHLTEEQLEEQERKEEESESKQESVH